MTLNRWPSSVIMFLAFAASLVFWPQQPLAPLTLASFLPHGLWAWWSLTRGGRFSWGWPLLAGALLWRVMPLAWLTALILSLYVLMPGLRALRQRDDYTLSSPYALWRLLMVLLGYVAVPAGLALALFMPFQNANHQAVLWLLQTWGTLALALMLLLPLRFWPNRPRAGQLLELALIALVIIVVWGALASSSMPGQVPSQIMLFPMLLWAAYRGGLLGTSLISLLITIMLSLSGLHPRLAVLAGTGDFSIDVALSLMFVAAGQLVAILSDSQRRHERLAQEFRYRMESLVNHSPNMMSLKGLDGRYLLVNQSYANWVQALPEQILGQRAEAFFSAEDAEKIRQQDAEVLRTLEARQFEECITLGGERRVTLVSKFPLFDADGRPAGVGSVDADISAIRQEKQAKREAEQRYRALVEQSLMGIYILQDERIVYANPKLASLLGYPQQDLQDISLETLLGASEYQRMRHQIAHRFREQINIMHFATRARRQDGMMVDVEVHSRLFDYQGRPAIIGVVMDISERVSADANLRLAAKVFENSAEGILILDADTRIVAVNDAFHRITGYDEAHALGRQSRIFLQHDVAINRHLRDALALHGHWQGEMMDRRRNGEWYPAELSISTVRDSNGTLSNYVAVFSDITVRKQAEERLQFLANHDPLTRLPNRSSLIARLEQLIRQPESMSAAFAVMFIDLDRFKLINDSFGHQAGDELLRVLSLRLTDAIGSRGELARLGGDEFTLLVSGVTDQAELSTLAEDLLNILSRPLRLAEHEVYVTGSIGISVFPGDGADAQTLLKHADSAMYRAKEAGKNTYQFFDAEMNAHTFERLLLENGLRQGLERGEFELHYQPQVSASSHELAGVEALIRWRHPDLGLVPPARFIGLAEETGLIKSIGEWVLREACQQLARWQQQGIWVPRVAVNLSARQFEDLALLQHIHDALAAADLEPQRLELEMTESLVMQNPTEAVRLLTELKSLGVCLSIDDFGTGYSSLSYLKRFPLNTLKIDRSFVDGLPHDEDNAAIAEAILAMSRKLKFAVVAEGVETAEQADFLQTKGCHMLQGYLFSKPVPAEAFAAVYARLAEAVPSVAPTGLLAR